MHSRDEKPPMVYHDKDDDVRAPQRFKMISLPNRVSRYVTAAIVSLCIVVFLLSSRSFHKAPPPPPPPAPPPPPRYEFLGLKDFEEYAEVATIRFKPQESSKSAAVPTLQKLGASLPKFSRFKVNDPAFNESIIDTLTPGKAPEVITVDIAPIKDEVDASEIVFGAATTLERMEEALKGFRHWAANTKTRFVFIVEPQDSEKHPGQPSSAAVIEMYKKAGINLTLVESTEGYLDRYVMLLGVLHDHLDTKTKWAAIIDDDTFFFSMRTLTDMLAKYDTTKPYYVGSTSENKWNIDEGGIFAIGGAGVFMSRAMIDMMGPLSQACVDMPNKYGDSRVADCIFKYTTIKLSQEHELYQLDLHGDVTGFYEAVRPQPVGVHHWKTWHHHDMPTVSSVSKVCGQACVLQNLKFADGWQMANGFSIIKYSYNETQLATQMEHDMEHTWKLTIWDIPTSWKYSLEPLKDKDEGKIQYVVEKAVEDPKTGSVTSYYVRRKDGIGKAVIRVTWEKHESMLDRIWR